MFMKKNIFFVSALLVALAGPGQGRNTPVVIEGKVIADATGQPVINAHVYIVDGEEEALTGHNGEFRIESWQKAPLTVTVNTYQHYQKVRVVITDPSRRQLIRLKIKQE